MDEFKYQIELNEINNETKVTMLKKKISTYYSLANSNAYSKDGSWPLSGLRYKLRSLNLARAAQDRYISLGKNISKLPQMHQGTPITFNVDLRGAIDDIIKLLEESTKCQD